MTRFSRRQGAALLAVLAGLIGTAAAATDLAAAASASPAGLTTAAASSAAHQGARVCGPHACIYAYVDATADGHTITGSGTAVVVDKPSPVARLAVDRVTIDNGVSTLATAGPSDPGNAQPVTQHASAPINGAACEIFRVTATVSARLSNGETIRGQIISLPLTSSAANCPQLPSALGVAPGTLCATVGGSDGHPVEDCLGAGVRAVLAPDHSRVFVVGAITVRGRTPYGFRSVRIDALRLRDGVHTVAQTRVVDSGDLPVTTSQIVTVAGRTFGLQPQAGCHVYSAAMAYSTLARNGQVFRGRVEFSAKLCV